MGVIANIGYTDNYGVTHRVDIDLVGYSGTNTELVGTATPIIVSHESLDPKLLFTSPIVKSNIAIEFYIDDTTALSLVENIINATEGNYQLKYYKGGTLDRTVDVLADQSSYTEQSVGRVARLVGKDFSRLSQTSYPLTTGRLPIIEVLADILPYSLPITTLTRWVNANQANVTRDFLGQIYIERRALRNYATRDDQDETEILAIDALNYIARNFKIFIKQSGGRWYIEQMSAYNAPSSVLTTLYDTDGAFVSASNTNRTQSSLTIRDISSNSPLPGLKRVESTFNHRQQLQGIVLPEVFRLGGTFPLSQSYTQAFVPDGTKAVRIGGTVSLGFFSDVVGSFFGQVQIQSGTFYFNNQSRTWTTNVHTINIPLQSTLLGEQGQPEPWNVYAGYFGIETTPVPVGGGNLTITYFAYPQSPVGSIIAYSDNEFTVVGDEANQIATSIRYELTQALDYSVNYNDGQVLYGEGPVAFSDSALSSLNTTNSQIVDGWYRRGNVTDWSFAELFTREVMEFQIGAVRLLSATIMGNIDPSKVVSYDAKAFYVAGSDYNVFTGQTTVSLIEIAYADATATLAVGLISGPTSIGQGFYNAINVATREAFEAQGQIQYRLSQTASGTVTNLIVRNELTAPYLFRQGDEVLLVHPITLDKDRLTVASDQFAGSNIIQVTSATLSAIYPPGSWIFVSQNSINAAILVGRDAVKIFAEGTSVGVTNLESIGLVTSIQVVLNTRVQAGDDLAVINALDGTKRAFTVGQTAGPGLVTLQLDQATVFDAPAGSYIIGSNAQYEAFLQVTPAGVLAKAEAVTTQNSFAILSAPLPSGIATTTIPVTSVRTLKLLDASQIGVQDKAGNTEFFQVDGQQDLSPATTVITVVSKAPSVTVGSGAGVFQPMWNQTAILSVQAGEIATRVTSSEVQTLIDQNIDGLLPALSLPFENSAEGFTGTGTNATLTPNATYLEYLATGSTPFMQRTTSYSASDNPIVTIRVQRFAGTNWGGAFGWSTDGTNFFTQNFIEPAGIDLDFQFTTLDLTSNTNYTGTIVAIRIYLGEANLDEFYIDTLSVGKFNPQTEILADLSSRLTVAEAGLLNTSTEFTTYTQNGVLLNGSAKVNEIRNATTMYDTVIITDTRGGFSVRNNQDYYLVNTDGTFQAVKIRDDQTIANVTSPTNVTLKIQSVTFATTIQVGAVLYESAFTQSTRISQSAGQIVLKAEETAGEVTSLALVRLDGSVASGSSVTIQGDLVAINNIEIIRGSGSDNGLIRSQGFISGSTGWRIFGDGTAEFNDVTVRGSIFVTGGDAATETYADGVANQALSDAEDYADGLANTVSDATPRVFRQNTAPTTSNRTDNSLQAGDLWYKTNEGDLPHTYTGTVWQRSYTQIEGGNITTGTIRADLVTIQNADASPSLTIDNNGINLVYQSYLTNLGSGLKWYDGATLKGVIWNDASEGDNTLNYFVTNSNGRHLFGAGTSDPDERFEINANFARTGTNQGLRVFGDFQARGDLRIYDSDKSHYYNIVGGDLTGNRQLNIPALTAARTFAFIDQAQTFSANQTFNAGLGVQATAGGVATIAYAAGSTANRTFTFPSVASAATVAVLEHAQTFTGANTFNTNVVVPNASADTHALNRTTADGRYVRPSVATTYTAVQTFSSRIDLFANVRIYESGANFRATLDYSGSTNQTSTLPEATGTLVTTANLNQDIAGTKRFTGTLRASAYRSSDNTAGVTDVIDTGAVILNFKNGLFVGTS
jgi:hypothetical protein